MSALRTIVGPGLTWRHAAWLTLGASLALSLLGVYAIDLGSHAAPPDSGPIHFSGLALRQGLFVAAGLLLALIAAVPDYRLVRLLAWPALGIAIALLVFLLIPAVPTWLVRARNGARSWIDLGPVDFQPSELAKIAFVLVLADYLRFRKNHRRARGLIAPAVITFIPVALITLQPDLGTAMLFIPGLVAMLLAAGARIRHLLIAAVAATLAGPAAYPLLKPHQQRRIIGMIHLVQGGQAGADDINYQSIKAMMLAGAGGLTGNDDPHSRALLRFNSLPERHNDMVLAVVMNRFGLAGGLGVLGLYAAWIVGALLTAGACKDPFGRLVVVGLTAIVAGQTVVNIGMNVGLVPIIGVPLPFVSYGGTSMLTCWLMTGLVLSVAMRRPAPLSRESFEFGDDDA